MKKFIYISMLFLATSACSKKQAPASSTSAAPDDANVKVVTTTTNVEPTEPEKPRDEIKWMSYSEAVKQSKKNKKKIFIDVYTDWCGWCKKMDKTTFKDSKVVSYMNKNFYAVKLDAESDAKVMFQGKELTERDLATKVFRITGYPSTVYLEYDEKIIQPVPGYMDVTTLDKILHYIGEDHYKTQTWEQFQVSYKSE